MAELRLPSYGIGTTALLRCLEPALRAYLKPTTTPDGISGAEFAEASLNLLALGAMLTAAGQHCVEFCEHMSGNETPDPPLESMALLGRDAASKAMDHLCDEGEAEAALRN